MPDLTLGETEQAALRSLLAAAPVPGECVPGTQILEHVSRLIPCDAIGVGLCDDTGFILEEVSLPRDWSDAGDPQACEGPLPLGIQHFGEQPDHADLLASLGIKDTLAIGFRNGPALVAQLYLDRKRTPFADRDIAMLTLIGPSLEALLRTRPTPTLPPSLTLQERRVLQQVKAGHSNAEIAERLFVSQSTVRKHLENAYRKLGVSNRVAAVMRLEAV